MLVLATKHEVPLLIHGHEHFHSRSPSLSQTDVARLAHGCLAEVLKETARRCGGSVVEEHGLLLVCGRHPCPIFVNSALRTGYMEAREAFERAAAFFRACGNEYEFWIREGQDDDLLAGATQSGMRFSAELRGMVLHAPPEAAQLPLGVEVRRVENLEGFQDFKEIAAQGFRDEAPGCYDLVLSIFPDLPTVLAPDTSAFVVYVDGSPVSTGLTMLKNGIAWIGWIATRQEARGRGYGRLATIAAVRAGFTSGATLASLEATRMGVPVYLRLGFREVVRYRNYWPGTA